MVYIRFTLYLLLTIYFALQLWSFALVPGPVTRSPQDECKLGVHHMIVPIYEQIYSVNIVYTIKTLYITNNVRVN